MLIDHPDGHRDARMRLMIAERTASGKRQFGQSMTVRAESPHER
jgi:hypothetical protein